MKFSVQALPHRPAASPAPTRVNSTLPTAAGIAAPASPMIPNVRIDRVEMDGCGAISPASFRAGFHDAWVSGKHSATQWSAASSGLFHAPLTLQMTPGLSGRELGRILAKAILIRAEQSDQAT